jgi:hypothetical protein
MLKSSASRVCVPRVAIATVPFMPQASTEIALIGLSQITTRRAFFTARGSMKKGAPVFSPWVWVFTPPFSSGSAYRSSTAATWPGFRVRQMHASAGPPWPNSPGAALSLVNVFQPIVFSAAARSAVAFGIPRCSTR